MNEDDISELIEDSEVESTKKQIKYVVSRMNSHKLFNKLFSKSSSLFWYYVKILNVFIRAMVSIFSFSERWNVPFSSAIVSLIGTYHFSPHENILITIAVINIHYLYSVDEKSPVLR